ncbi:MAG: PIN domain-containing protein [Chloroflexi bacterium]|nr:PIN domain-containing protein [Chloroflexota bacterium]
MILDADALSAFLENTPEAVEIVAEAREVALTVLVAEEFAFGSARSRRREAHERALRRMLDRCTVLNVEVVTARRDAATRLELNRAGAIEFQSRSRRRTGRVTPLRRFITTLVRPRLELIGIMQVDPPPAGTLVANEIRLANEEDDLAPEFGFGAVRPGLSESDAFDRHQHVDSHRRGAQLIEEALAGEVRGNEPGQRRAEPGKRAENLTGVLLGRLDSDGEVFSVERLVVEHRRVPAGNKLPNARVVEKLQQIFEVWAHLLDRNGGHGLPPPFARRLRKWRLDPDAAKRRCQRSGPSR